MKTFEIEAKDLREGDVIVGRPGESDILVEKIDDLSRWAIQFRNQNDSVFVLGPSHGLLIRRGT